jgi:hypothetical protein
MTVPWLIATATAAWFGLMARSAGRAWSLWTLGGGAFGLVTATIVWGVNESATIPFTEQQKQLMQLKWTLISVLLVGAIGWLLTLGLHRQHQTLWRVASQRQQSPAETPAPIHPPKS